MMNSTSYQPPIDKLLTLGLSLRLNTGKQEYDYIVELGLGSQHIPDLMRMGCDRALLNADSGSLDVWAVVHAWRALGQLNAESGALAELTAGIAPLMQLFHELEDNELVSEELPKFFSRIGAAAISPLAGYLADDSHKLFSRVNAINSLEEIAKQNENIKNDCIFVLTQQLKNYQLNSPELNGFIIATLINLEGKTSAPVIKMAFAENQVTEDIVGSWEEVKQSLGVSADDELQVEVFENAVEVVTPMVEIQVPIPVIENQGVETQRNVTFSDAIVNNSGVEINAVEELPVEVQEDVGGSVENNEQVNIVNHDSSIAEEVLKGNTSDIDVIPEVEITVEEAQAEVNVVGVVSNLAIQDEIDETSKLEIIEEANFVDAQLIESNDIEEIRGFGKVVNPKDKDKNKDKSKQKKKKRNFADL